MKLTLPHLHLLLFAIVALLLNTGAQVFLPNYTGSILDAVAHGNSSEFFSLLKTYSILACTTALFGAIRSLCISLVGRRVAKDVRAKLFSSIMVQDIAFFDGFPTGQLTSRLTQDTSAMISPLNTILNSMLSSLFLLVGGLFMCLYTSWRLSILAFTSIFPVVYIMNVYAQWSRGLNRQIWAALGDANAVATESISNIRIVRAFGRETNEISKFGQSVGLALKKGVRDAIAGAGAYAITNYIDLGAGVLILGYGGSIALGSTHKLTVGKLITFQLYWQLINSSYQNLTGVVSSLTRAGGAATRVLTLLDSLPDIDPSSGRKIYREHIKGDLRLENLHFTYPMRPENPVLSGLSLHVKPNQVVAIVGKSGGGKSTIISLLQRLYDPQGGQILLDGQDYKTLNAADLRRCFGCVQQDTTLFNRTIEENIVYGADEQYTVAEVEEAAREANAYDFIMEQEEGR